MLTCHTDVDTDSLVEFSLSMRVDSKICCHNIFFRKHSGAARLMHLHWLVDSFVEIRRIIQTQQAVKSIQRWTSRYPKKSSLGRIRAMPNQCDDQRRRPITRALPVLLPNSPNIPSLRKQIKTYSHQKCLGENTMLRRTWHDIASRCVGWNAVAFKYVACTMHVVPTYIACLSTCVQPEVGR